MKTLKGNKCDFVHCGKSKKKKKNCDINLYRFIKNRCNRK